MSDYPLYTVFGGAFRSAVPFDDLPASTAQTADWTLIEAGAFGGARGEQLGEDIVYGTTLVRGFRTGSGYALEFDDTGRFEISENGATITWYRPPDAVLDSARADITSRVLALALHARGVFSLHASAVSLPVGGLTFMAPKHHGKSTLCSALVLAGARALSDDTVPVRPGNPTLISPGLPRLRLWSDSAARLFGVEPKDDTVRKRLMDELDETRIETRSIPYAAAYVLAPVTGLPDGSAVARVPLDPVSATIALIAHSKLGPVLAGSESPAMLALASEIARSVPVYTLHIVRDLDRIEEVARTIIDWHSVGARTSDA